MERFASLSFIVGVITMPISSFPAAWRSSATELFIIPVATVMMGIIAVLLG